MGILAFVTSFWRRITGGPAGHPVEIDEPRGVAGPARPAPVSPVATPPPVTVAVEAKPEATSDEFDLALDAAFGARPGGGDAGDDDEPAPAERNPQDEEATRELFSSIAANYSRPVKNFIFELKRGTATKEWIEICRPVMGSIIDAAESMELDSVARCMVDFDEALSMAKSEEGHELVGESRELILSVYEELVEALPDTFLLSEADHQREAVIIHSLLRQIPEVGYVTIEKLYRAGLTSLDTLFLASKDDMASATGVPVWLCEHICDKVQEHRRRLEQTSPGVAQLDHGERLVKLVEELRRQHEAFERAAREGWSDPALSAQKREARLMRHGCALKINVVLAEMGELDLVDQIQKLAFGRRIERLEAYLRSTREARPPVGLAGDVHSAFEQTPARR